MAIVGIGNAAGLRHIFKMLDERYKREIAEGKTERMSPEWEAAIKAFQDGCIDDGRKLDEKQQSDRTNARPPTTKA